MLSTGHSVVLHLCHPSPFIPLYVSLSLFLSDCRSNCVAGSDRCAILLLLCMKGGKKKKKTRLVLHMSALFLELLRSWPHYTDLHTHSPILSLSVCLFKLIAECRWALFSQAGQLHGACTEKKKVCVHMRVRVGLHVCVCPSGRGDERVVTGVLTC